MRKLLAGLLIGGFIVLLWRHVTTAPPAGGSPGVRRPATANAPSAARFAVEREDFRCDGRVYCSEMTSCAEARYFLQHCPGVKMDGEGDAIPCENQWCGKP